MRLAVLITHAWVRRGPILVSLGLMIASLILVWWLFLSPDARLTAKGQAHRRLVQLSTEIVRRSEFVKSLSQDPKVPAMLTGFSQANYSLRRYENQQGLEAIRDALADMESKLDEEYTVVAVPQDTVSGPNKHTIVFDLPDSEGKKIKSYYLFVQARKDDGSEIPRRIESTITAQSKVVTTWGEQIPEAVEDRLATDKQSDGILNETAFAIKRKGMLDEEVTMPGADGKTPLVRLGRITGW